MARFVDVALPVPLDQTFTYLTDGREPQVGARVLVPFSGQRLMGVVLRAHDEEPTTGFELKAIQQVLDDTALLPPELLRLAHWIAQYYVAPLGEVLRGMLPLSAEVRRTWLYRITDTGRKILHEGAEKGSSRRSRLSPEDQNREYAVLNRLESGEPTRMATLRSATGASKALLEGMVRKGWLAREAEAAERDAARTERVIVTVPDVRLPKLNDNQLAILAEMAGAGGELSAAALRRNLRERTAINADGALVPAPIPDSTVATLIRRGILRAEERPLSFHLGGVHAPGKKHAHEHTLNPGQQAAFEAIHAAMQRAAAPAQQPADASPAGFAPMLLFGVTGSGKTAVYAAAMRSALDLGRSALLLVPEIGLTPSMAGQMHAAFGHDVALLHSQLTPDERAEQWHRIRRSEARVIIGTRSAVFAPIANLGLILVDEEHDGSYKQEETPRYHARDVAVMRAKLLGIPIVLGSATPSLESWHNAERNRYRLLRMDERVGNRPLPPVELVDMREEFRQTGEDALFSRELITETRATLNRGEQAIILLNRRGYSYVVMCRSCGERIECENCAIAMTHHRPAANSDLHAHAGERLECHYCGALRRVPQKCPHCQSEHLYFYGAGSQQGEERLQAIFPEARIGRMDRDTVRGRADMEHLLHRLHAGEINLLVGTQMIAKGHDIHGVTTVGVVGCDHALGLPDFRAAERVFQLITQVSGRAGRGDAPGRVIVQTFHPDHYAMRFAAMHDYVGFADKEKQFRRPFLYPPFGVLTNVLTLSETMGEASEWAHRLGQHLHSAANPGVRVLGPAPAPVSRLKRIFRFHILLKADTRQHMQAALRRLLHFADREGVPRRNLVIDVDAISLS
ncbi:replication restart helicase PriA [Terriglobus aquaticus]|uniref:Replication restart protein PriA n=1 Tax=Terriglobus aquaticus TaxID=940139 RepID=A0ABW9KLK6_9BACT|nr:primosomal protein N' [Terriglobus aquaticus]